MGTKKTPEQFAASSLVERPNSSLAPAGRGGRVVSRMTADVLDVLRRGEHLANAERHRVGDIELDGPNYRQVLRWAAQLGWSAEQVIEDLHFSRDSYGVTEIDDGAITGLYLDGCYLPIRKIEWEPGLRIKRIVNRQDNILTCPSSEALPSLRELTTEILDEFDLAVVPHLESLTYDSCREAKLDLSGVPGLTTLICTHGHLTELDLSHVPNLTYLDCSFNQITSLDLSHVPNLTHLNCSSNRITNLDLSLVSNLSYASCNNNRLTTLALPLVSTLTELHCRNNQLTEINLSTSENLRNLDCSNNQLLTLKLNAVPNLEELDCCNSHVTKSDCGNNRITELDLSSVPKIVRLGCGNNQITHLDLLRVPRLNRLSCSGNMLTELDLRGIEKSLLYVFAERNVRIIQD